MLAHAAIIGRMANLKPGDELHAALLSAGYGEALTKYLAEGNLKRSATPDRTSDIDYLDDLAWAFDNGGHLVGGTVLAKITGRAFESGDMDIAFKGEEKWTQAVLKLRESPFFDVCLYLEEPWETFDLAIVQCAFSPFTGLCAAPACEKAIDSRVSDIILANIIDAPATAQRMRKYNARLGMHYNRAQVMAMCAMHGLPKELTHYLMRISRSV